MQLLFLVSSVVRFVGEKRDFYFQSSGNNLLDSHDNSSSFSLIVLKDTWLENNKLLLGTTTTQDWIKETHSPI